MAGTLYTPLMLPLRSWLRSLPSLATLVADRVFIGELPAGSPLPAVVLQLVNDRTDRLAVGQADVQADCWGQNGHAAEQVFAALKSELETTKERTLMPDDLMFMGAETQGGSWRPEYHSARYSLTFRLWTVTQVAA